MIFKLDKQCYLKTAMILKLDQQSQKQQQRPTITKTPSLSILRLGCQECEVSSRNQGAWNPTKLREALTMVR